MKYLTSEEIHVVLLDILSEFDRICREHDLKYSLAYGTLLGAIRHKGFIPWDDDVDVVMPRPDYERFYELIRSGEAALSKHFVLSEDRGKKAVYPFLKLMDDRFSIKCSTHIEVPYLFIDIFPLDGMPDLPPEQLKKMHRKELIYNGITSICKWYIPNHWWGYLLYVVGFWFYLGVMCYGQARAINKLKKLLLKYPYEEHDKVDCRAWGMTVDTVPRAYFDSFEEVDFAGRKFFVISSWDEQLTVRYGDYMTPPPPNKRRSDHSFKIYRNKRPD